MRRLAAALALVASVTALSGCLTFVFNRETEEHHYHGDDPARDAVEVTVEECTSVDATTPWEALDETLSH